MEPGVLVPIVVVVVLVALLALYLWASYRSLVTLRQRVDEAWSDIVQQLHRRADLVPQLVESVQGYASHERTVFQTAADARTESVEASTPAAATAAETHLQQALRSVYAVAENYPKLSASQGFLQLQGDMVDSEEQVQASRRFYNGGVRELNTRIQVFPNRMFAKRLGFGQREFFEVADGPAVAQPPRIQF